MIKPFLEYNSIFMHSRSIMRYLKNMNSISYRVVCLLTFLTCLIFRIGVNIYLLYFFLNKENHENIGFVRYIFGLIGTALFLVINLYLFYDSVYFDFIRPWLRRTLRRNE